ncbi:MAG: hypothetical protein ACI8PZ_001558 [Myxococcota bacterium]
MSEFDTCMLCPRLCRSACPVVTGSAREAATPTWIATVVREWEAGRLDEAVAREAVTLCTDCGACQDHCHLDRPLPQLLRDVRRRLLPSTQLPTWDVPQGEVLLAVADARDWSVALAALPGAALWVAADNATGAALESGAKFGTRFGETLAGRQVVVADGAVAALLDAHDIAYSWLHESVADAGGCGSCRTGGDRPLACCGAAGPLRSAHPEDADRVAHLWVERGGADVVDARCRAHLRRAGHPARDVLDRMES